MKNRLSQPITFLLIILSVTACQSSGTFQKATPSSPVIQVLPSATPTNRITSSQIPSLAYSLTPTLITATVTTTLSPTPNKPRPIYAVHDGVEFATGSIDHLWWSSDSRILYYDINTSLWEYIPSTDLHNEISSMPYETPTPPVELTSQLPKNFSNLIFSPSHNSAFFEMPVKYPYIPTPTATISPTETGEYFVGPYQVELWYWDGQKAQKIDVIDNCLGKIHWSSDEKKVIIEAEGSKDACLSSNAWLVDLENLKIINILPKAEYKTVYYESASPDLTKILYATRNEAFVLDLPNKQTIKLDLPFFLSSGWLNDDQFIIYCGVKDSSNWKIGLYSLSSGKMEVLVDFAQAVVLQGKRLNEMEISPDSQMFAFAVGKDPYYINSIWIVKVGSD